MADTNQQPQSAIHLQSTGNPILDAALQAVLGRVLTPGSSTSEGRLSLILTVISMVVAGLSQVLDIFGASYPNSHAIHLAISTVALLGAALTAIGYGNSRTGLKQSALNWVAQLHANSVAGAAAVAASTAPSTPSAGTPTLNVSTPVSELPAGPISAEHVNWLAGSAREVVEVDGRKIVAVGQESIAHLKALAAQLGIDKVKPA